MIFCHLTENPEKTRKICENDNFDFTKKKIVLPKSLFSQVFFPSSRASKTARLGSTPLKT